MVESLSELKKICHNNSRFTDRPIWYRAYRALSIRFTRLIILSGIHVNPTYITILESVMSIVGAAMLISTNTFWLSLAFIFMFLAYLFDCVDGELARYYKQFSTAGSYIDEVGHAVVDPLLFVAMSIASFIEQPHFSVIIMGFLTSFLIRFIKTNYQLDSFIFFKEFLSSPERFVVSEISKSTANKLLAFVNSLKHYVITVFIIMIAYLLDGFGVIPPLGFVNFKVVVLLFYSIFLSLIAIAQVLLHIKNIEKELSVRYTRLKFIFDDARQKKRDSRLK